MQVIFYEMKKMYLHQKGLIFICLFFALSIAVLFITDKPMNADVEVNSQQYSFYMNKVQGRCTEQTEQFLLNETESISNANISLEKLYSDYYDGKIHQDEFKEKEKALEAVAANQKGFELVFDQYIYIHENPNNRYFLYTNGWDGLLSDDSLDLFLTLLILLLVTPVFCCEFESEMNSLSLTAKKGAKHQAVCKICLVLITVTLLCVLTSCVRYGFYQFKYGLDNGNYPLQSLSYFASSTKSISLIETFFMVSLLKLFGFLSFSVLILFVSVLIKKYALTVFSCAAVVLIPYFGFSVASTKYLIPGPLSFMISTGFFKGSELERDVLTNEMYTVFQEVTNMRLLALIAINLCIAIVMLYVILWRNKNIWGTSKRVHKLKLLSFLIAICISMTSFTGCSNHKNTSNYDVYNSLSRMFYENERYRYYVDESDLKNTRLVFEDKESGKKKNFVRNPMKSLIQVQNYVYGNGSFVYYMKCDMDRSDTRGEGVSRVSIIGVDTKTFNEKIIFEKSICSPKDKFLGLNRVNKSDLLSLHSQSAFFLDDHYIYFIDDNVYQMDRKTGKVNIISIPTPTSRNIAYDGQNIYYIDNKLQLCKYDTKTDTHIVIPNIITPFFFLTDTDVFFINRMDKNKIYTMNLGDSTIKKISDKEVQAIDRCDDKYIYYTKKNSYQKYRMNRDGTNVVMIEE